MQNLSFVKILDQRCVQRNTLIPVVFLTVPKYNAFGHRVVNNMAMGVQLAQTLMFRNTILANVIPQESLKRN
jgi:hypothetical protein